MLTTSIDILRSNYHGIQSRKRYPTAVDSEGSLSMPKVIQIACYTIEVLLKSNDCIIVLPEDLTRFHAKTVPDISVLKYIKRIVKYAPLPPECLVTALVYLDRVALSHPEFIINSFNIHRLLISAILLAVKFHCDQLYSNNHYARIGGISSNELKSLEFGMLDMLGFNINVTKQDLDIYLVRMFDLYQRGQSNQITGFGSKKLEHLSGVGKTGYEKYGGNKEIVQFRHKRSKSMKRRDFAQLHSVPIKYHRIDDEMIYQKNLIERIEKDTNFIWSHTELTLEDPAMRIY